MLGSIGAADVGFIASDESESSGSLHGGRSGASIGPTGEGRPNGRPILMHELGDRKTGGKLPSRSNVSADRGSLQVR